MDERWKEQLDRIYRIFLIERGLWKIFTLWGCLVLKKAGRLKMSLTTKTPSHKEFFLGAFVSSWLMAYLLSMDPVFPGGSPRVSGQRRIVELSGKYLRFGVFGAEKSWTGKKS